jgi:hypothetical protein
MNVVYAREGSEEFNNRLHAVLLRIGVDVATAMGENLVALLLGGGYGRGEGGVLTTPGGELPYNDLDFTLVVKHKGATPWPSLKAISERYGDELKIHVDFSRPLTLKDIRNWPHWLMWYDLVHGHVVLYGEPDILRRHAPVSLLEPLPLIEAVRLLLNRGAGLLWALRVLKGLEKEQDKDFVRRNYYKCALALGDALLMAYGRYTSVYYGRDARLSSLREKHAEIAAFDLDALYREALRFKFKPADCPVEGFDEARLGQLAIRWGAIFLHVERMRTSHRWASLAAYTQWRGLREKDQHTPEKILRNLVRNREMGRWSWRYPREELYRQLPVLLSLTPGTILDWDAASASFLKTWDRFN